MNNFHIYFATILLTIIQSIYSLEIGPALLHLVNGQTAKVDIIDTNGCAIEYLRMDKKVTLKKDLIKMLIVGTDTIRFDISNCENKNTIKISRPRFEINIKNYNDCKKRILKGSTLFVCPKPINGTISNSLAIQASRNFINELKNEFNVVEVSLDSINDMIESNDTNRTLVLIINYFKINAWSNDGGYNSNGQISISSEGRTAYIRSSIIDLKDNCILQTDEGTARKVIPRIIPVDMLNLNNQLLEECYSSLRIKTSNK